MLMWRLLAVQLLVVCAVKPTEEQIRGMRMEKGIKQGVKDRIASTSVPLTDFEGANATLPTVYHCEGCRVVLEEVELHLNRVMEEHFKKVYLLKAALSIDYLHSPG
jgi:hypothetical protein